MQLRLPLCGVCGACRWERNKSNIDCRAALPPAGDPQTCRPGSKCFSPPKLAWEAAGAAELHPQHWDCLRPNDGAGDRHTYTHAYTETGMLACAQTHTDTHTQSFPDWYNISRTLAPVKHTLGQENHTDINTPAPLSAVEHTHSLSKDHSPQVFLFTSQTNPQNYLAKLRI